MNIPKLLYFYELSSEELSLSLLDSPDDDSVRSGSCADGLPFGDSVGLADFLLDGVRPNDPAAAAAAEVSAWRALR
jgi:hypothetical protein